MATTIVTTVDLEYDNERLPAGTELELRVENKEGARAVAPDKSIWIINRGEYKHKEESDG